MDGRITEKHNSMSPATITVDEFELLLKCKSASGVVGRLSLPPRVKGQYLEQYLYTCKCIRLLKLLNI